MKTLRTLMLLLGISVLAACGGDDPVDNPTPTPTPTPTPAAAKIDIAATENTSPILAQTGGKASLSFTSSGSWTATSSAAWCTVSPTSGNAGNATITITAADNDTYDERTATVTLKSGNATQSIKVSQVQKDAIVLALSEYTVEAAASTLEFEIQTNVDVTTEVDKDAQSWITQADTRALHAMKLSFDIAANTDTKERTGTITIKGNDVVQTVTVKQKYDDTATERKALMAFYNSTNGSKWTRNDNWGSDKPLDQWYGIYTENRHVTQIELENNNLTGKIPEEIGQLKQLQTIWLVNNHLTGGIPKSIADLPVLENLILSGNQLTGSIPVEIGNIKTLGSLSLRNNSFSGAIPDNLCNLTNLQHLFLSGGSITGRIPENIGNLKSLRTLNIDDCQLSGTFPESIGQCTNLEDITIRNANIALPIPASFANLKNLKLIDLSGNNLTGELPLVFAKVESLENLWLNWNNLTGGIPDEYMQLKNLKELNVYHNKMDGYISREMSESDWWKNLVVTYSQQDGYQLKFANPYESTDFSHDGEVKQIRKHSKGKGIKLVIIGDCFSDRLIADGTFDKQMEKTADAFFGVEPFTSFADYFDVYSVAAVSKNEDKNLDVAFSTTATNGVYNYDVDKVKEYVLKIPDLKGSLANVTTLFVVNEKEENIYHTYMWDDGFSIAMCGTPNIEIIQHEGGGHGFGLLADEYGGGEEGPSSEAIQSIANYHKKGWMQNIDTKSDPSKVLWKDFISNADYQVEGIGVYEGGFGYGKGVYRPTEHSIMNDNFGTFNAPSRWIIYQRIMKLAGESYTFDDFLKYDKKNLKSGTRSMKAVRQRKTLPPVFLNYPSSEIGRH